MDKRDKNIEDFFNKSLEQFSDAPSSAVWEGIAEKLGQERVPFYRGWRFWVTTFLAMTLLALLTYGYTSTQEAINLLTLKTNQLVQENQELKLALNDCSIESANLLSDKEKLMNLPVETGPHNFVENGNKDLTIVNEFKKRPIVKPATTLVFANFNKNKSSLLPRKVDLFSDDLFRTNNSLLANGNIGGGITLTNRLFYTTDKITANQGRTTATERDIESPFSEEIIATAKKKGFHHLAKLATRDLGGQRVKTNFKRNLPNYFRDYSALNLIQPIKSKLDVRVGWSFGGMNTFTDQKDLLGPGYNSGITSEWKLFNSVYLTAAFHHNEQRYEVKLNASNQHILQSYPGIDELTNVVTSINQHVHYLDLPIGLKWYFKENKRGTKFFINPAVAWQFYFPQQFEYEQATNSGIITKSYTNQQFFGYFGTAQIQLGLEEPLFKKMNYQLGLWAEKSLIPLGVENRNLFNVGIRGAIFFN